MSRSNRAPEIAQAQAGQERAEELAARVNAQDREVRTKVRYLERRGRVNHFGVSMLKAFGANPEEFYGSR